MGSVEQRVDTAIKQAIRQRNYRRVRDRALRRLSNLYPDQYRTLLAEEKVRDEAESKVWLDINGRTRAGMGKTGINTGGITKRDGDSKPEGYDGGEA